jgi:hypothetical protein
LESTIQLKIVLQVLGFVALILVAILDHVFINRGKLFRWIRLFLFFVLAAILIVNLLLVDKEDQDRRREIKELNDSAAIRDSILIDRIETMRKGLEAFIRKTKTKAPDIATRGDLRNMIMKLDSMRAEVQKKVVSPVYIDVPPNRIGAEIFADEVFMGAAPCSILVDSGMHNLRVTYIDRSTGYSWQHIRPLKVPGQPIVILKNNDFLKTKLGEE